MRFPHEMEGFIYFNVTHSIGQLYASHPVAIQGGFESYIVRRTWLSELPLSNSNRGI